MNNTLAVQILNSPIHYSRGTSKYDNAPTQCTATNFDDFEAAVLADMSVQKGLAFVCAPLESGFHYQKPDEYPGQAHWRLANYALPRAFLPFDFDGFASVEAFQALLKYLQRYRGFGYTTASATSEAPRARAILEASRPITRGEGKMIGEKLQAQILAALGEDSIKFDDSVYRGEQPVYTPVVTSETYHFPGSAVDVDALLSSPPKMSHHEAAVRVITPEYLASLPTAFVIPEKISDGDGREDFILRYAGHLRGKGLDQSIIERILLDYNQQHIVEPLDDDAVLDRARRYQSADPIQAANDTDWPAPEEIAATLPPVPAFDPRLLPPVFREWVGDIADRMQCPVEYLAVGAMVAAGAVVGNRIGVQPKRHDIGWVEVPNLWGAVVGRPGVMKSPALAQVLSPLKRLEANGLVEFNATRNRYEIDRMQYDAAKKKIEVDIKKGLPILPGQFPVEPEEPQPPRLLLNDSTYQKLGQVLSGNPHGLMVFQDELSGLLVRLDGDGQEAARAFYLEAWNGQQSYTFDRIERGTVRIPRLCFSLLGGLQPSKLREYLRSAVYGGKGDDGLAQRLQLLVYPDISGDWKRVDRHPDLEAAAAADAVFGRLASLDPVALGARIPFDDGIPVLRFSDDAQHLFNVWWELLEKSMRQSEHHPALESHISKYRKLVPAMALLDHLILGTQGDIQLESLKRAILWQQFLLEHAKRAYAAVTSATMDSAKALSQHIQRGALKDGFTVRDVYRHNWSLLSSTKEAAEAVAVLVDLGWLRAVQDARQNNTEGRPTVRHYIHPRFRVAA